MFPDLQISKSIEFLTIYMHLFCIWFWFRLHFLLSLKICCKMGLEWSGEAETESKWSDGLSGGFGMGFDQAFLEKQHFPIQWKNSENCSEMVIGTCSENCTENAVKKQWTISGNKMNKQWTTAVNKKQWKKPWKTVKPLHGENTAYFQCVVRCSNVQVFHCSGCACFSQFVTVFSLMCHCSCPLFFHNVSTACSCFHKCFTQVFTHVFTQAFTQARLARLGGWLG